MQTQSHQRSWAWPLRLGALAALLTLLVGGIGGSLPAIAQEATPVPGEEPTRTITVGGNGSVNVAPDTATVELGVTETNTSLAEAQAQVTARLEAILAALAEAGVAEDDIKTAAYNVQINYEYDDNGNLRGINGYTVSSTLSVTVRGLDSLGTILDTVVTAGANVVYGITFSVDDPTGPASEARRLAVEDARAKADELAAAAGVSIIGVISIQETSSPGPAPVPFEAAEADMASGRAASAVPVQAGTTEVIVDVVVVFEISGGN